MIAILDASVLYGALSQRDPDHARCVEVVERPNLDLVVPALVVSEVAYLLEHRAGPRAEATFLRSLTRVEVEAPTVDEWPLIADLVERYADFPLGTVDASVAVLADRLDTDVIVTLDRRHFAAIRSARGGPYRLLPE